VNYADLPDLAGLLAHFRAVRHPEEVFGDLPGAGRAMLEEARRRYVKLAFVVHPDTRYAAADTAEATEATALLNYWWERARAKIAAGLYGRMGEAVLIQTRLREYTVTDLLAKGDKSSLYHCAFTLDGQARRGIFKIARDPADNDLLRSEADILRHLMDADTDGTFAGYFPHLTEAFGYHDGGTTRQALVLRYVTEIALPTELYSLREVRAAYPDGVDPRDMAWMWRRTLTAIGWAHRQNIIHGALLPTHILIQPRLHGVILIDWAYAVRSDAREPIRALSAEYEAWYPAEVFAKEPPLNGHDIYMAARCMVDLMGGDPLRKTFPASVPDALQRYFLWCMTEGARMRPQNAWNLLKEFDSVIERLYGKRTFREFRMPE
jgi:hypothetical protein